MTGKYGEPPERFGELDGPWDPIMRAWRDAIPGLLGDAHAVAVAIQLATRVLKEQITRPTSRAELAAATCLSEREIARSTKVLEQAGWQKISGGRYYQSTTWRVPTTAEIQLAIRAQGANRSPCDVAVQGANRSPYRVPIGHPGGEPGCQIVTLGVSQGDLLPLQGANRSPWPDGFLPESYVISIAYGAASRRLRSSKKPQIRRESQKQREASKQDGACVRAHVASSLCPTDGTLLPRASARGAAAEKRSDLTDSSSRDSLESGAKPQGPRRKGMLPRASSSNRAEADTFFLAYRRATWAVRRLVHIADPATQPYWFGTRPPAQEALQAAVATIRDDIGPDASVALYGALAPFYVPAGDLLQFDAYQKADRMPQRVLQRLLQTFPADLLGRLASYPQIHGDREMPPPGIFEAATLVIQAGEGYTWEHKPSYRFDLWTSELIDRIDRIEQYGVRSFWLAKYEFWQKQRPIREAAGKPVRNPAIWDLLLYTPDPTTNGHARVESKKPLHCFLGLDDSVEIDWVPAGFKLNSQHELLAARAYKGNGQDRGLPSDIRSIDGGTYVTGERNIFLSRHHYDKHLALRVTPENFLEFKALFRDEPSFREWWDANIGGAPTVEAYRRYGVHADRLEEGDMLLGKTIRWRKSL